MTRLRRPQPVDEHDGDQHDDTSFVEARRPEAVCRTCREPLQYCECQWPEAVRWSVR